ncbi:hypothetical protein IY145_19975 [Methylosinus sp. H3A]|uniref:hypothetical protein n=1 Tax=Methylosinus sp. H3A TaxID=2785786 RepID=UPI0018C3346D|nr:hypothetical protein [Methylosinus sp. H3A]MBG0811633.1 hypothetical protein [Methylosinus sp. H3A]
MAVNNGFAGNYGFLTLANAAPSRFDGDGVMPRLRSAPSLQRELRVREKSPDLKRSPHWERWDRNSFQKIEAAPAHIFSITTNYL